MRLSVAHVINELNHAEALLFKYDCSVSLWTVSYDMFINMSGVMKPPIFRLSIKITSDFSFLIYENTIKIESSGHIFYDLYRCAREDPNVLSAMSNSLRYNWYLKYKDRETEEGGNLFADEIVDYLLR